MTPCRIVATLAAVVATLFSACSGDYDYSQARFECSTDGDCPDSQYCSADNRCRDRGNKPDKEDFYIPDFSLLCKGLYDCRYYMNTSDQFDTPEQCEFSLGTLASTLIVESNEDCQRFASELIDAAGCFQGGDCPAFFEQCLEALGDLDGFTGQCPALQEQAQGDGQ